MEREKHRIFLFEQKIRQMILRHQMILSGQTVLIGVSGGADSVCLLLVLKKLSAQLGFSVRAVHVEHGIRKEESLADAAYVQELCGEYEVPLTVKQVCVPKLARESGRSIEEEARVRRYRIFLETAGAAGAERVAVAHHLEDQAETVLWNLIRGSSIRGLAGMRPVRVMSDSARQPSARPGQMTGADDAAARKVPLQKATVLIRPLLEVSRTEIEQYLEDRGVSFRFDRTNQDTEITRNKIRLEILPALEGLNSRAQQHMADAAGQAAEVEEYLEKVTGAASSGCIQTGKDPSGGRESGMPVLMLDPFYREDPVIRKRILRECIRQAMPGGSLKDITRTHVEDLLRLSELDNGKSVSLPHGVRAEREEGVIRFTEEKGEETGGKNFLNSKEEENNENREAGTNAGKADEISPPADEIRIRVPFSGERQASFGQWLFTLRCGQAGEEEAAIPRKRFTKWIAYDTIPQSDGRSLCFRTRRPGDYLMIGPSGERKKLSDYFTDQKIPVRLRDETVLLAAGSHVLWVVGGRISEGAKVKPGACYVRIVCVKTGRWRKT